VQIPYPFDEPAASQSAKSLQPEASPLLSVQALGAEHVERSNVKRAELQESGIGDFEH
jgi:hypothetical protein